VYDVCNTLFEVFKYKELHSSQSNSAHEALFVYYHNLWRAMEFRNSELVEREGALKTKIATLEKEAEATP
jgi:hypothetical protein